MTLDDLKHALATDHDFRTLVGNLIHASVPPPPPLPANVLTLDNVHESVGLYERLRETVGEELDKRGLGTPPPPTL